MVFGQLATKNIWLTIKVIYICIFSPLATITKSQRMVAMDMFSSSVSPLESWFLVVDCQNGQLLIGPIQICPNPELNVVH